MAILHPHHQSAAAPCAEAKAKAKAKAKANAKAKAQAKAKANTQAKAKAISAIQKPLVSPSVGRLYITKVTQQSYIQYRTDDGKLRLHVGLGAGSCPYHKTVVVDLAVWVAKNPKASLHQVL